MKIEISVFSYIIHIYMHNFPMIVGGEIIIPQPPYTWNYTPLSTNLIIVVNDKQFLTRVKFQDFSFESKERYLKEKKRQKKELYCTYCDFTGHDKSICYILHGFPYNISLRLKNRIIRTFDREVRRRKKKKNI